MSTAATAGGGSSGGIPSAKAIVSQTPWVQWPPDEDLEMTRGCPHEPATLYSPAMKALFCRECAPVAPTSGNPLAEHISTLLREAEALYDELTLRQKNAQRSLACCPSFSELEGEREKAKAAVDEFLLCLVRHIDRTRNRLHQDIDAVVAERASQIGHLVSLIKAVEPLSAYRSALKRSADFDTIRALQSLKIIQRNVAVLDDLAKLGAAVSQPIRFEFKKDWSCFDLEALRVTVAPPRADDELHAPTAASPGRSNSSIASDEGGASSVRSVAPFFATMMTDLLGSSTPVAPRFV